MKKAILLGYLLLFFKFNLTINDMGYIYLISNIAGSAILYNAFKNTEEKKFTLFTVFYLVLNAIFFILSLLDFNITSLAISNSVSFVVSLLVLIGLFYNFLYPLFSFSYIIGKLTKGSFHFARVTAIIKIALFLAPLSLVSFFISPSFASISILAIIIMELASIPLLTHGFQQEFKESRKK